MNSEVFVTCQHVVCQTCWCRRNCDLCDHKKTGFEQTSAVDNGINIITFDGCDPEYVSIETESDTDRCSLIHQRKWQNNNCGLCQIEDYNDFIDIHEGIVFHEKLELPLVVIFNKSVNRSNYYSQLNNGEVSIPTRTGSHDTKLNMSHASVNCPLQHNDNEEGGDISSPCLQVTSNFNKKTTSAHSSGILPKSIVQTSVSNKDSNNDVLSGSNNIGLDYVTGLSKLPQIYVVPSLSTVEESLSEHLESVQETHWSENSDDSMTSSECKDQPKQTTQTVSSRDADVRDKSSLSRSASLRRRRHMSTVDIEEVKSLTSRLNLVTRRPSINDWRSKHFVGGAPSLNILPQTDIDDVEFGWSRDVRDRINESLDWLKTELVNMSFISLIIL